MHLKSGNKTLADESLESAIKELYEVRKLEKSTVIWIGDFNRASIALPYTWSEYKGGGQSKWNLDRVVFAGVRLRKLVKRVSKSGDNAHIGISVEIED